MNFEMTQSKAWREFHTRFVVDHDCDNLTSVSVMAYGETDGERRLGFAVSDHKTQDDRFAAYWLCLNGDINFLGWFTGAVDVESYMADGYRAELTSR